MLASDVTDQTQYYINEIASGDTPAEKEQDLRAQFELPPKPKAFIDDDDVARMNHLNQLAATRDVAALRLEMCLAPEPSILKSDIKIPREVLQNTSYLCQLKLKQPRDLAGDETANTDGMKSTESSQSDTSTEPSGDHLLHKPSMLDVLNAYDPAKPLTITALA